MKKKKLTALFMGMALAFSLTACSGIKTSDTAGNDNRSETESKNNTILDNSQADENSSEADDSQENDTAQADQTETSGENSGILIAYFSIPEDVDTDGVDAVAGASIVVKDNQTMGNTEYVAGLIQETVGGSLFRIETKEQYPLDHDPLVEQAAYEQDADARPALETHIENPDQYDTIILGYPNWWGDLPQLQPDAVVSDNTLSLSRNSVADSREDVIAWAESLGL